jgi:ribosomal protein L37E
MLKCAIRYKVEEGGGQFVEDTVGQLTGGSDPSPTPPLRGEGLSSSPFPTREGGWGVRFSEFANSLVEVPTRKVKPSQTCPRCGHQQPKTLDERIIHHCAECGYQQDRDIAPAEVCLYWVQGTLPGFGTNLVDGDGSSSTSSPKTRKSC